jgi:putative transposase
MMVDRKHRLPMVQQCRILELSRSSVYYRPQPVSAADLALMHRIDELHLQHPFAGCRMLRDILQNSGVSIGRKHVATLMRRMGIEALYQRPRTSKPHVEGGGKLRRWSAKNCDAEFISDLL